MLTNRILPIAAGFVLAVTLGTSSYAGTNGAVTPKSHTYDITFDGYCDGMNLTLSNKYYVVGQSTGCSAGGVDEGFTATRSGIKYLDISSNNSGSSWALTFIFTVPIQTGGHWTLYGTTDGVTQSFINSGTYTVGTFGMWGPKPSFDSQR